MLFLCVALAPIEHAFPGLYSAWRTTIRGSPDQALAEDFFACVVLAVAPSGNDSTAASQAASSFLGALPRQDCISRLSTTRALAPARCTFNPQARCPQNS